MKKEKKRLRCIEMDANQFKKKQFKIRCIVLLPVAIYLGYALSGIATGHIDLHHIYSSYFWCLLHPKKIWYEKSWGFAAGGFVVWMIAAAEGWIKLSYNLMHGKEYGDSKWGDIFRFNDKYASAVTFFQQQGFMFKVKLKNIPDEVKKLAF